MLSYIDLLIGTRVRLTTNTLQECGLYNGAMALYTVMSAVAADRRPLSNVFQPILQNWRMKMEKYQLFL